MLSLVSAVLMSAPAGLNPYLPLLFTSVIARYTDRFAPRPLFGFVGETWFVTLAGVLFLANVFLDKVFVPGDSLAVPSRERDRRRWLGAIHDLGQMILGPLSGAILMGASDHFFPESVPLLAPMLGALLAALAYVGKRAWRHRWSERWGGFSNLLFSTFEDSAAALLSVLGILLVAMA
jgi:hypothetical protein